MIITYKTLFHEINPEKLREYIIYEKLYNTRKWNP